MGELKEVSLPNGDIITYKQTADNQRVAKLKNGEGEELAGGFILEHTFAASL
ncbi:hypothetical protein [Sulfurimonas sp. HSL3-7]|uniref:hypothetical protein n=1 Tax=Sulfonitrofixus jiaomeiensis TaxID=3131938 RepID=UPI0031F9E366